MAADELTIRASEWPRSRHHHALRPPVYVISGYCVDMPNSESFSGALEASFCLLPYLQSSPLSRPIPATPSVELA